MRLSSYSYPGERAAWLPAVVAVLLSFLLFAHLSSLDPAHAVCRGLSGRVKMGLLKAERKKKKKTKEDKRGEKKQGSCESGEEKHIYDWRPAREGEQACVCGLA